MPRPERTLSARLARFCAASPRRAHMGGARRGGRPGWRVLVHAGLGGVVFAAALGLNACAPAQAGFVGANRLPGLPAHDGQAAIQIAEHLHRLPPRARQRFATDFLSNQSDRQIARTPRALQGALLESMAIDDFTGAEITQRDRIYRQIGIDPGFARWDARQRDRLAQALATDGLVMRGLRAWPQLSPSARAEWLERVGEIEGEIYGFTPAPISFFSQPTHRDGAGDKVVQYGNYSRETGHIHLNTHDDAEYGRNGWQVLTVLIHEQAHAWQLELARAYEDDELAATDPLYAQARLFSINWQPADRLSGRFNRLTEGGYADYRSHPDAYPAQPLERHAAELSDSVIRKLRKTMQGPGFWQRLKDAIAEGARARPAA